MSNVINISTTSNEKISLQDAKGSVLMYKGEAYTFFDEGCTRYVYTNKSNTKVIKILKDSRSIDYNVQEADIYKKAKPEDKELMVNTILVNGLIEQDFCLPIKFGGKKLTIQQRLFATSCRNEVGWGADDKLVCFDLDEYKKY